MKSLANDLVALENLTLTTELVITGGGGIGGVYGSQPNGGIGFDYGTPGA